MSETISFQFYGPIESDATCQKKKSSPSTHLAPHIFEYTLGIANRVELFRFDQIRNRGLRPSLEAHLHMPCFHEEVSWAALAAWRWRKREKLVKIN